MSTANKSLFLARIGHMSACCEPMYYVKPRSYLFIRFCIFLTYLKYNVQMYNQGNVCIKVWSMTVIAIISNVPDCFRALWQNEGKYGDTAGVITPFSRIFDV